MGYIKKEKVEEIKEKSDIVSVVGDYVSLSKSGKYFLGRCPFHNEKTPSFFVYPDSNSFHCFGCGKHGNSISFLMDIDSLDYISALTKLAEKFGIQIEYEKSKNIENKYDDYYKLNEFVAKFYYKNMMENVTPKKYLADRGISQKSINTFLVGYADGDWKSLVNELTSKNFDLKMALELGLIIETKNGEYIDRFRNRIMFPILNRYKKVIGFGGRTIVDDKAKYLNSPESVIFKKGENLYAIDKVIDRNIRDKILIVEGYMDVISLYQQGVNYVVAGLGTALTESQARLARQFGGNNIYICYDGDNAGINATNKAYSIFESISVKPKILKLPEKLDPDDYIKKFGVAEFEKLQERAYDIYDFNYLYLKNLISDKNEIRDRMELYNDILNFLNSIDNNLLKETFIKNFSKELEIDEKSIKNDLENLNKKISNFKKASEDEEVFYRPNINTLSNNDKKILILGIILLMRGSKDIINYYDDIYYLSRESGIEKILLYVLDCYNKKDILLPEDLVDKFKNDERILNIISYILSVYESIGEISIEDYAVSLKISRLSVEIRKVTNNIDILRNMDRNSDTDKNLNVNIQKLMKLNKEIKNLRIEKGIHYE